MLVRLLLYLLVWFFAYKEYSLDLECSSIGQFPSITNVACAYFTISLVSIAVSFEQESNGSITQGTVYLQNCAYVEPRGRHKRLSPDLSR